MTFLLGLSIIIFLSIGYGFHNTPFSNKIDSSGFFINNYKSKALSTNTINPTSLSSVKRSSDNSDILDPSVSVISFMISISPL